MSNFHDKRALRSAATWIAAGVASVLSVSQISSAAQVRQPAETSSPTPENAIAISDLGRVDPMTIGALDPQTGALPASQWSGVEIDRALDLVARIDVTRSYAGNDLAARVLASPSAAPAGEGAERLAIARLDALERLGRWDEATIIIQASEPSLPGLARPAAWAALARDDLDAACRFAETGVEPASVDGVRLRAACAAFRGDGAAAALILDLAEEADLAGVDAEFRGWIARAASDTPAGRATPVRDLLEVRLALAAGGPIGETTTAALPISAAAGLMRTEAAPLVQRAIAAERAVAAGAAEPDDYVAALVGLQGPKHRKSSDLLEAALASEGPTRAALLIQAAEEASSPAERAAALAAALEGADSAKAFHAAARLHGERLRSLTSDRSAADYAPVIAEALAVLGEAASARAWLALRPDRADGPADLTGEGSIALEASLIPEDASALAVIIAAADRDASGVVLAETATARLNAVADAGDVAARQAAADAAILVALGASNTSALRASAERAVAGAEPLSADALALLHALDLAAAAGSLAETALLSALSIDAAPPGHVEAATRSVRALRGVGLADEARSVAVEALLIARRGE